VFIRAALIRMLLGVWLLSEPEVRLGCRVFKRRPSFRGIRTWCGGLQDAFAVEAARFFLLLLRSLDTSH
jgi:hypothetical protein